MISIGRWAGHAAIMLGSALWLASAPAALAAAVDQGQPAEVTLSSADVQRSGVQAQAVTVTAVPQRVQAYATVLDPAPLFQLVADIDALSDAASLSRTDANRNARLLAADETVSRKTSEAATVTARADSAKLSAARRRIALEWGRGLATLPAAQLQQILKQLSAGRSALLRIGLTKTPPHELAVSITGADSEALPVQLLGLAAMGDPAYSGPSLLALASSENLQPGRLLSVQLSGSPQSGVLLPAEAVLTGHDGRYVYLETAPGHYQPCPVKVLDDGKDGLLLSGIATNAKVVVHNAAAVHWAASASKGE